ncbi:MAG: ribonuclease III [Defluviicoccus sp.]|nr:ribonuclease III [Defluviicoccus sp.]
MAGPVALEEVEAALGYSFADRGLLEEALTHASAARGGRRPSLERLEFLGDRVLGLGLAAMLCEAHPDEAPGDLARRHARLASGETLASIGRQIGLQRHLRVERGHDREALPPSMIEDSCEAIIGAVYLDGGHSAAMAVVEKFWERLIGDRPRQDPKTALQEWALARALPLPSYALVATDGPAHAPILTVEVRVAGYEPVRASAGSKRAAEQVAARDLLDIVAATGG